SRLVLVLNLLGFALGFVILTTVELGFGGLFVPSRLVVLCNNLAAGIVYSSAQSALNDLAFARLRERLGIREIGKRRRDLHVTLRQVLMTAGIAVYILMYMQFNTRDATAFHAIETETLRSMASGELSAEEAGGAYRERVLLALPGLAARPGFDPASVPLPWESKVSYESMQLRVFLLCMSFILTIAVGAQAVVSLGTRDQVQAIIARIRDVLEGGGDLRTRLSLRSMDEYGELTDLLNRLLDRFRDVVGRISAAAAQTREGASAISRALADAERASSANGKAVLALTASLEAQAAESRGLVGAVEAFRGSAAAVAESVEGQRRFAAETAAAMEEMSANIRSVEALTARSGALTAELSDRGAAGAAAVTDTGAAIAAVESAADGVLKTLGSLSKIAGDTNLLAMNAAIEAAHAGEQGAGFAVVADEVRTLATNAARQTKAIKGLVVAMYDRVRRGVESSGASGEAIRSLSSGIGQAAAISLKIADAMKEQAAGTKSVEDSLVQVVEASDSIKSSVGEQVAETDRMAESLDLALRRLSDLAVSSRSQADAVRALESSYSIVRQEVDSNLAAVQDLDKLLEGFKL
ncbi:MAG: methyl-accepting chemotaxis protein, partial [Spirochaetaceae bacterium]|nr:methyl-accepting chemotaxis protein [Spirochaetaceae bacterium]